MSIGGGNAYRVPSRLTSLVHTIHLSASPTLSKRRPIDTMTSVCLHSIRSCFFKDASSELAAILLSSMAGFRLSFRRMLFVSDTRAVPRIALSFASACPTVRSD